MTQHLRLTPQELGTIEAILLGFNHNQLPRLLDIKKRVDGGEVLNEFELTFLEETLKEVQAIEHLADKSDPFKLLVAEVAELYGHITSVAAANQAGEI